MGVNDRDSLVNLQINNGKTRPFYISLFPESLNSKEEKMYQLFAKLSEVDSVTSAFYNRDSSGINVEEI